MLELVLQIQFTLVVKIAKICIVQKIFKLNTSKLITNYCLSLPSIILDMEKIKKLNYNFDENFSNF